MTKICSFTLLFGPKDFDSMIIDETPTEDAYYYDPYPITIICRENEEGEYVIDDVTYESEALEDERKVQKLVDILNFHFGPDDLMKDDEDESYNDVPTFMLSSRKYPEDYTYTCMKCETEFISFAPRYTAEKRAIMCPKCTQLHWVNFEDQTYRISEEIIRFQKHLEDKVFRYISPLLESNPQKKRLSYLIEHSLFAPESLDRYRKLECATEMECYRAIEELTIEQLRYFLIEQGGGYREKLLHDCRIVRELNTIKKLVIPE